MTIFVIVGIMTEAHSFRSQVGIGSESDCLLGLLNIQFTHKLVGIFSTSAQNCPPVAHNAVV